MMRLLVPGTGTGTGTYRWWLSPMDGSLESRCSGCPMLLFSRGI
jgi:hypothetical protein